MTNQSGQGNQMGQSGSGDIKQVGKEIVEEAKSAVSNATSQVKSQATDIAGNAQEQATHFLDEQKGMAAQRIEGVANALRHAGQELAGNDEGTLAQYTDTLASQLDNFSNSLREREIGSLLDDAKQLAYRQPELFVAGALAAGFVIGRFFKSSRRAYRSDDNSYGEYDPRDPSRMYGQQYGESYNQEFGRGYSPEYSQGYGSGYRAGATTGYGSEYGGPYDQPGQGSSRQYGQRPSQNYGQSYGESSQRSTQNPSQNFGQGSAQRTTHGLGSGQSIDREAELRKGQEFGQGEEQVSNYNSEQSVANRSSQQGASQQGASQQGSSQQRGSQQSGSQRPNTREGGEGA
jgi:hypothetical protein